MIQLKLAWHSLVNNWQRYALFVLSSSLLIAINYIFISILQNPSLNSSANNGSIVRVIVAVGFVFIALLSMFFMFYANGFLTRQRDHELGIYNLLGMTHRDLNRIVFYQNAIMYIVSLVIGLVVGITGEELAFLGLRRLLDNQNIVGSVSWFSVLAVAGMFLTLHVVLLAYGAFQRRHLNPISLLNAADKAPVEPKSHWIMGITGIVILAIGYYLSITTKPRASAMLTFMGAAILVVIGTYLLFITGSILILKALRKNKKYYYQPNHFISVSGMLFRMKQNGAGLASICLLCTSTLVVLVSTITLFVGYQHSLGNFMPYDMVITTEKSLTPAQTSDINALAKKYNIQLSNQRQMQATPAIPVDIRGNQVEPVADDAIYDTTVTLNLISISVDQYNQWQGKDFHLNDDELLIYSPKKQLKTDTLVIKGKTYHIKQIQHFDMPNSYADSAPHVIYAIASNKEIAQDLVGTKDNEQNTYVLDMAGKFDNRLAFAKAVQKDLESSAGFRTADNKPEIEGVLRSIFGGILFVGALISIVLTITTALIIYYKQISEGVADRGNFETMQRVGLSFNETKKAIHSQILTVFMLPIVGAIINLGFAYPALKSVLKIFGVWHQRIFVQVAVTVTIILLLCYITIYTLTARVYQRIVNH